MEDPEGQVMANLSGQEEDEQETGQAEEEQYWERRRS